jgi:hypothetical protein
VLDSGGDRFFDAVLDDGLVNEGKHLLGDDLRGGEKAGTEAAGGKNYFSHLLCHYVSLNSKLRE